MAAEKYTVEEVVEAAGQMFLALNPIHIGMKSVGGPRVEKLTEAINTFVKKSSRMKSFDFDQIITLLEKGDTATALSILKKKAQI